MFRNLIPIFPIYNLFRKYNFYNCSMQSYKLHIVSQHLNKRHPYLEPPFNARYNNTEVYYAVFDRSIPKLIQILLIENLESYKYRDALITLNQIVSNQNEKDLMITQGLIGITSAYIHSKNIEIRRQAVLLLGSLISSTRGLPLLDKLAFSGIEKLLFDEQIQVRNSIAWCICRIVLSRTGVDILCKNNIIPAIIKSFIEFSGLQEDTEQKFLIYLLQAFTHLLSYDNGINFALKTGLTKRLNFLCKTRVYSKEGNIIIHYLSLDNLSKIATNPQGKEEAIVQKIIKTASQFLFSEVPQEVKNAVVVIMLTSIHLQGKKQCVYDTRGIVETGIIIKLINLLVSTDKHLRGDVIQCLKIISQLQDGFLAITDYMAREGFIPYLEEIFGSKVVVALANLLPKPEDLESPPNLPTLKIDEYKSYAKALSYFLARYEQAIQIALEETVDLCLKLLPFLCFRGDRQVQEGVVQSLLRLISKDKHSKNCTKEYLSRFGKVPIKTIQTTLIAEIANFKKLQEAISH